MLNYTLLAFRRNIFAIASAGILFWQNGLMN
jgi:hypothetical protein